MSFWTPQHLQSVTQGLWLQEPAEAGCRMRGLATDSRAIRPGEVFLALRGKNFDGHAFLAQAAAGGASMAVVETLPKESGVPQGFPVLQVADSLRALQDLAADYRNRLRATIIGVTGSAGKTTTKRLIHAVLATSLKGSCSPKSFNNHIGVPLTLLAADPADDYVVVEIGMNAPGEIAALTAIVRPDIAVITQVGAAHLEGLGSIAAILQEKASILKHLNKGGVGIINLDVPGLLEQVPDISRISYGTGTHTDLRLTAYEPTASGCRFEVDGHLQCRLPILGRHNALNALAAIAAGRHLRLKDARIVEGLAAASNESMRLSVDRIGDETSGIELINDAYNANPLSMAAALNVLVERSKPAGRKIAILGDMGELGEEGPGLHRDLGRQAAAAAIDGVIFVGPLSAFAAEVLRREKPEKCLQACLQADEASYRQMAQLLRPQDTVLLKASRFMELEKLVGVIRERFAGTQHGAA